MQIHEWAIPGRLMRPDIVNLVQRHKLDGHMAHRQEKRSIALPSVADTFDPIGA
jgi:hypothetical protein